MGGSGSRTDSASTRSGSGPPLLDEEPQGGARFAIDVNVNEGRDTAEVNRFLVQIGARDSQSL